MEAPLREIAHLGSVATRVLAKQTPDRVVRDASRFEIADGHRLRERRVQRCRHPSAWRRAVVRRRWLPRRSRGGHLAAARVAHEAIGRLLAAATSAGRGELS